MVRGTGLRMPTFDFSFETAYKVAGLPFGVTPSTTRVDVAEGELRVAFGPWRLVTPVTNIASTQITGPYSFTKTAGPAHLSFSDRGVTFATTGRNGVCVRFHQPVRAIDPFGAIRHPGATITVADPAGLCTAIEAAQATAVEV